MVLQVVELARGHRPVRLACRVLADNWVDVGIADEEDDDRSGIGNQTSDAVDSFLSAGKSKLSDANGPSTDLSRLSGALRPGVVAVVAGLSPDEQSNLRSTVRNRGGTVVAYEPGIPETPGVASGSGAPFGELIFHAAGAGYVTPRSSRLLGSSAESTVPRAPRGHVIDHFIGLWLANVTLACHYQACSEWVPVLGIDCVLTLVRRELAAWHCDRRIIDRQARAWKVAPSDFYATRDGYAYVFAVEAHQWASLCELLGLQSIRDNPMFASPERRYSNRRHLDAHLAPALREWNREELVNKAGDAGVPIGPVSTHREAALHDQVHARAVLENQDGSLNFWLGSPGSLRAAGVRNPG